MRIVDSYRFAADWVSVRRLAAVGLPFLFIATLILRDLFPVLLLFPVGVTTGVALFALLGESSMETIYTGVGVQTNNSGVLPRLLTILFFIVCSISILFTRIAAYDKPLSYFIAVAFLIGILMIRIVFTEAYRSNAILAILLGLNIFGSNQLVFPLGMGGPDESYHVPLVEHIYETNHVVTGSVTYSAFPGQHLTSAVSGIITGLSAQGAYRMIGLLGMLVLAFAVYLLGRRLGGVTLAMFVMIFYVTMSYVVFRGSHPTQMAHILPTFVFLFLSLFYILDRNEYRWRFIFVIFAFDIVVKHHYTAFIALIMVSVVTSAWCIFDKLSRRDNWFIHSKSPYRTINSYSPTRGKIVLPLIFGLVYITHLSFTSGIVSNITELFVSFIYSLLNPAPQDLESASRFSGIPLPVFYINTVGEAILSALAVLGCLVHLQLRDQRWLTIITWLASAILLILVGMIVEFPFVIPQRLYVIIQITALGFLAATGVMYLLSYATSLSTPSRNAAIAGVFAVVCVFALFSTASIIAGISTSPFNDDIPHPLLYDVAEQKESEEFMRSVGVKPQSIQWERSFPVQSDGTIDYSNAPSGSVIGLNYIRIESGIQVSDGSGLGAVSYTYLNRHTQGLDGSDRFYTNGRVDLYKV